MRTLPAVFALALIHWMAPRLGAQPAVIRPAAYPSDPRLFLFVVDSSYGMKRQAPAARATVATLLGNGAQGRMRRGDLFCVWTFQDTVTTNLMAWERWQPELAPALGSTAARLLEAVRHNGRPNQDAAVKAFVQLARDTRELIVFLLNDGSEVLYGTPFDLPISTLYIEHGKKLATDKRPFVTTLVARHGEISAWSVDAAGLAINIPSLPDEPPPVAKPTPAPPPSKPEPPKPQSSVAQVEPAPVKPAPQKIEPSPPPVQNPKANPAPPPKSSPAVSTTATPPKPATPPAKGEPPVVEPPKTASVATAPTPPAHKPVEPKPPESKPAEKTEETKPSVTQQPQPAPLPVAGVEKTAPSSPPASPAAITGAPPPPLPSAAPVATVESVPVGAPAETNAVAASPVEPPAAPAVDEARAAPAQTAALLPPQPGSSTSLYLAFGLGLLVAAGAIGFFVLLRRPRSAAGGSLISESLDREQRETAGGKPRPRKPGID